MPPQSPLEIRDLKAHYSSYLAAGNVNVYNPVSTVDALAKKKIENYWVSTGLQLGDFD
jgi:hypothetical protein